MGLKTHRTWRVQFSGETPSCLKQSRAPRPQWNLQVQGFGSPWTDVCVCGGNQWWFCWGFNFSQGSLPYFSLPAMLSTQRLRETNYVFFLSSLPFCLDEILWQKHPEGEKTYFSLSQGFIPSCLGGQDSRILKQPVTSHSQWWTESTDGILAGAPISVSSLCNPSFPARGTAKFINKVAYPVSTKRIKLIPHSHAQKPIF